ncbi:MAG: hypothetical protein N4A47_04920 [Clostridia bacterium]|jgi:hypothetical protein|nr:hypothetical protein [Clostridia bacterium]
MIKKIVFSMVIIIVLSIKCSAEKIILDYKDMNPNEVATAKLELINKTTNERQVSNFIDYPRETKFDQQPTILKAIEGDEIELRDLSIPSQNELDIEKWDLQIYSPSGKKWINVYSNIKDVEKTIVMDEAGTWKFYLCVKDSAPLKEGYENWSYNGNRRAIKKVPNLDNVYYYWYFTQINVEVYEKPDSNLYIEGNISGDILSFTGISKVYDISKYKVEALETTLDSGVGNYGKVIEKNIKLEFEENTSIDIVIEDANGKKAYKKLQYSPHEKVNPKTEIKLLSGGVETDQFVPEKVSDVDGIINAIEWSYVDSDKFKKANIEIYRLSDNGEVLIYRGRCDKRSYIFKGGYGIYKVLCSVENELEEYAEDSGIFYVSEPKPSVEITADSKVFQKDNLKISIDEKDDEYPNKYYEVTYKSWEIISIYNNKTILSGDGRIPSKIYIDQSFEEGNSYVIKQKIENGIFTADSETIFYVERVLLPTINMTNFNIFEGETKEIDVDIYQTYESDFKYEDKIEKRYEILDSDMNIIKSARGVKNIFNSNGYEVGKNYYYKQYATNVKGKTSDRKISFSVMKVNSPEITMEIVDRDEDILTLPNQIYIGETIILETKVKDNYFEIIDEYYEIKNHKFNGIVNGEIYFNFELGDNLITQYATNAKYKTANDTVRVFVREPEIPIIRSRGDLVENVYIRDEINLKLEILDVNKSDMHPNGYELEGHYRVVCEDENVILEENGISTGLLTIDSRYSVNKKYKFIQVVNNVEHKDKKATFEYSFRVLNRFPNIEAEVFIGDNKLPNYMGEYINIDLLITDEDGYIETVEYNKKKALKEKFVNGKYYANIKYKADKIGSEEIIIKAIDDAGGISTKRILIDIGYPNIELELKFNGDRMKENRYITLDIEDNNKTDMKIQKYEIDYDSELVRLVYNDMGSYGMYFKKKGEYKFRVRGICDNEIVTKWFEKSINIEEDFVPNSGFKVMNKGHRVIEGENFGSIELGCVGNKNLDDEVISIYKITYDYNENGIYEEDEIDYVGDFNDIYDGKNLGNYKIERVVTDNIKQLPDKGHELHDEIRRKVKKSRTILKDIFIDNLRPTITFNYNDEKDITLIVQYDFHPTKDDRDAINELIDKLKGVGVRVNLVEDIY